MGVPSLADLSPGWVIPAPLDKHEHADQIPAGG